MVVSLAYPCCLQSSLHYRKRKMTDPAIYLINIKHATKELNEYLANANTPDNVRLAEILVLVKEIEEDARNLKAWAIDLNLRGSE
jgi:hypothetical protein